MNKKYILAPLLITASLTCSINAQSNFGTLKQDVPQGSSKALPTIEVPDPWASELTQSGKTDQPLDANNIASKAYLKEQAQILKERNRLKNLDKSIRLDMISGQRENILISVEHFVQVTLLQDGEVVMPTNIVAGSPEMLNIKMDGKKSPYIYVSATANAIGQPTNLFIETNENGKIQTYALRLLITEQSNITDQVVLNLISDTTPPIKGGKGSKANQKERQQLLADQINKNAVVAGDMSQTSWSLTGQSAKVGNPGSGYNTRKFSRDDVRSYFSTMVDMAKAYDSAKMVEKTKGTIIYSDRDIMPGAVAQKTWRDPVSNDIWTSRPWYFPRYDAVLLECNQYNPTDQPNGWNYSLALWNVGDSGMERYKPTAVKPEAPAALPGKSNRVWVLIQGNNISIDNQFIPVFPSAGEREWNR